MFVYKWPILHLGLQIFFWAHKSIDTQYIPLTSLKKKNRDVVCQPRILLSLRPWLQGALRMLPQMEEIGIPQKLGLSECSPNGGNQSSSKVIYHHMLYF